MISPTRILNYYKTNIGLIVELSTYQRNPNTLKINGQLIEDIASPTASKDWVLLRDIFEFNSIETIRNPAKVISRYVLRKPAMANEFIPSVLLPEQVNAYYDDDAEHFRWTEFDDVRPLYDVEHHQPEPIWEANTYEPVMIRHLQIDSYDVPAKTQIDLYDTHQFQKNTKTVDLSAIVHYSDIEKMLTPEFLLHKRPCALTSHQVYQIVRHHVRENIDGKYARITSDYDFCFTVKRKIAIKPYIHRRETKKANGRSYAKPKIKTSSVEHKEVELFEMTYSPYNYGGYTPISGWSANSLADMAEQMKEYLDALMYEINHAASECEVCNGTGHVNMFKVPTNARG